MLAVTKEPIFHKQNASPSDGIASTTLLVLWIDRERLEIKSWLAWLLRYPCKSNMAPGYGGATKNLIDLKRIF